MIVGIIDCVCSFWEDPCSDREGLPPHHQEVQAVQGAVSSKPGEYLLKKASL